VIVSWRRGFLRAGWGQAGVTCPDQTTRAAVRFDHHLEARRFWIFPICAGAVEAHRSHRWLMPLWGNGAAFRPPRFSDAACDCVVGME
jgi:hypothetical protein